MLAKIASTEGFHFEDTLTGFKWIGTRAAELARNDNYASLFCFEEALGFCCGGVIFDKDGISAMAVFAQLACSVYSNNNNNNSTVAGHLQILYDKYGEFVCQNGYYKFHDRSVVAQVFRDFGCGDPDKDGSSSSYPTEIGPYTISSIRYLGLPAYDSTKADKKPTLPTSKSSPMLTITFHNGCVAQFRPSGTENKFKYYLEMRGQPGVVRKNVEAALTTMKDVVLEEFFQVKEGVDSKDRGDRALLWKP